jgi:outer membrane lipoprotein-sorting protein
MIRVALALAALTGVAHADMGAADVLQRVESTYKAPQHFNAAFEQTTTNAMTGIPDKRSGTLFVAKNPDRLRFNYFNKGTTTLRHFFLYDGTTGWMVEPSKTQYYKEDMTKSTLPAVVKFFLGSGKLSDEFNVAFPAGKHDGVQLELTPKKTSAAYAKIQLTVDNKGYRVTRTLITDSSGNTIDYVFSNMVVDKPAPANTFVIDQKQLAGFKQQKKP